MTPPSPSEIWRFDTTHVGPRVLVFDELPSTNTFAADHCNEGDVFIALNQTAGRGRFDREWRSAPGRSLLMSVAITPPKSLRRPSILTAWAAVSVAKAIEPLAAVRPTIKWPNDLLIGGKKVCGILIEQRERTVVGIGLNLSQTPPDFADLPDATSLGIASGITIGVRTAAEAVVRNLDAEYELLVSGRRAAVETAWKTRTGLLGRNVLVELTDGTSFPARLRDMSFDGLEIETAEGFPRAIVPETVAHVRAL
ncbi:MAG TPA: biotin--[acetyl-CoA-carboxylase] ligase [Gemmataceae bacterium]|nr:biotin--[acetyl-CoA-carboxylase] ligase [Gemmataceae bacterium]